MAILHIRSVPESLYIRLKELAHHSNRSLSAQVVSMLQVALEEEERHRQQADVLASIYRRRYKSPESIPESVRLIREDRNR